MRSRTETATLAPVIKTSHVGVDVIDPVGLEERCQRKKTRRTSKSMEGTVRLSRAAGKGTFYRLSVRLSTRHPHCQNR